MSGKPSFGRGHLAWWVIGMVAAACLKSPLFAERPNAPQLLPDTTAVLVWIPDAPEMSQRSMNTSLGQMLQDPKLKPLVEHLYGSVAEVVASVEDQIGLSLSELLAIPQGELALAVVAPDEGRPEFLAVLDVGEQLSNARKLLDRLRAALDRSGAQKTEQSVGDTKLTIYEGLGDDERTLIFFERDATVVFGTSAEVLKHVISIWNGKGDESNTLAHNARFAAVMRRSGSKEQRPQIVLYADPIAMIRSIGQENVGARLAVAMLPALGLDGVKALGGSITFDAGPFDSVAYWHILLDSPRDGILKMVALESGDTEPEPWVPDDVANYMTLHWDFQTTFQELTSLYDSFRGEGALASLLKRRVKETLGVDIEKELLPALSGRVTYFSRIERPIRIQSQATAVGFQLTDPKAFGQIVNNVVEKIEAALARRSYAGKEYFQFVPRRFRTDTGEPSQPTPCFGIVDDYLVITDRPSLYQKVVVTSQGGAESLASTLDFKLIAAKIRQQSGGTKPAMIAFERPEEGMRLLYELAVSDETRQQLRQQAENNPFLRSLNAALEANPLPPFAVIEQYLAPGGGMIVNDESGLHYMSFGLRRKAESEE